MGIIVVYLCMIIYYVVYAGLMSKSADPGYGSGHSSEESGVYLPCLILHKI